MLPTLPLIGRSAEYGVLRDLMAAAARGAARMALVDGEAGVGKTRLVEEILEAAKSEGFAVLAGKADELGRDRPFGALADALDLTASSPDPARAALGSLLAEGTEVSVGFPAGPDVRYRIVDGVADLLVELARPAPVVLAVDDLQWADSGTLIALLRINRDLADLPVFLIGTLRPTPRAPDLEAFIAATLELGGTHLELLPLGPEAVEALVAEAAQAAPGPMLTQRMEGTAGNPLFILELLAALRDEGAIEVLEGEAELTREAFPPTLRLTILRRLRYLSDRTLSALRMAAVLGTSFAVSDLATVLDGEISDVAGDLDEAVRAGVLTESGEHLAFRHDLVREAVYSDVTRSVRVALHLQAARRLAASGASAIKVATQFSLGASPGDDEAVAWLRRASAEAFPRSPGTAERLLERAFELLPQGGPLRDEILSQRLFAMVWSGRVPEAESLAQQLLARPHDPKVGNVVRNSLARILVSQGRPADSLALLEAALEEPGIDDVDRAGLLAQVALRLGHVRDLDGSERVAFEAGEVAERALRSTSDAAARARAAVAACDAKFAISWLERCRGNLKRALAFAREGLALAREVLVEAQAAAPAVYLLMTLVPADETQEATDALAAALRDQSSGATYGAPPLHAMSALNNFFAGAWDLAVAEAEASLALADEVGMRAFALVPHSVLAHVALHRGDLDGAGRHLEAGEREIVPGNLSRYGLSLLLWGRARLFEAQGEPAAALSMLSGTWELFRTVDSIGECQELLPDLVRLAAAHGDSSLVHGAVDSAHEVARRGETASAWAAAQRCIALGGGDADQFRASVAAHRENPRPHARAAAFEEAAGALVAAGGTDEGVLLLREALDLYEELGAARDSGRAEAGLRTLGFRRGKRGPRGRPKAGWESLTTAELEVARLTARGLSNREIAERLFVSRFTVAAHLSHIFAKLGMSSRSQLAAEVSRRETVADVQE